MRYIQFFTKSTGYVPGSIPPRFDPAYVQPIEKLGSDGVMLVDGRFSPSTIASIARQECLKRGACGYRVYQGESFTRSQPISGYWPVPSGKDDKSAFSAAYGA